jgi:hypothetical protein
VPASGVTEKFCVTVVEPETVTCTHCTPGGTVVSARLSRPVLSAPADPGAVLDPPWAVSCDPQPRSVTAPAIATGTRGILARNDLKVGLLTESDFMERTVEPLRPRFLPFSEGFSHNSQAGNRMDTVRAFASGEARSSVRLSR